MTPTRVLLADHNPTDRQATLALIRQDPGFVVVGEAEDGVQAVALARQLQPDLVLMAIDLPRCDGLTATRLIKRELPHVAVVILTVHPDAVDLFEAIKSGAQGYLVKHLPPEDWIACLRGLVSGDAAIPRPLAQRLLAELALAASAADPAASLTHREREVLRLVGAALTNRQIAEALHISEQTVKNHLKNIMQKLQVKSRVALAVLAQRLRIDPAEGAGGYGGDGARR